MFFGRLIVILFFSKHNFLFKLQFNQKPYLKYDFSYPRGDLVHAFISPPLPQNKLNRAKVGR